MTIRTFLILTILSVLLAGCPPPRGVYHTVEAGQTLYAISRAYEVDEGYLARINHVDDPTLLRSGTRLYIPGAERVVPVGPTTKPSDPVVKTKHKQTIETVKKQQAPPVPVVKKSVPSRSSTASPPKTPSGTFSWPLKGDLVRKFSARDNTLSKGIEIAAPGGTPVLSSAAGRVIYSGNGIRGFGNLIILKHDDSFFTVYGFNSKNLVESGSYVSKGQRIALAGIPPSGGPSRLYFEIRHGKEPVDPIFYLP